MKRHCPHCRRNLELPLAALGHFVRCPACRGKFPVESPQERLDDFAFAWLLQDAEQTSLERQRHYGANRRAPEPAQAG